MPDVERCTLAEVRALRLKHLDARQHVACCTANIVADRPLQQYRKIGHLLLQQRLVLLRIHLRDCWHAFRGAFQDSDY